MNFTEIKQQLEDVNNINELFKLWQKAHICEEINSCNDTIPQGEEKIENKKTGKILSIAQDSFVKDGFISEKDFNGILFILKEANVLNYGAGRENAYECEPYIGEQFDFYKKFIKDEEGDNRSNQKEKMGRIAYYIEAEKDNKNDFQIIEESNNKYKNSLNKTAFMNLNKRGGTDKTIDKCLKSYIEKYREFIKKQIELINPKVVICLGTYKYLYSAKIINDGNKNLFYNIWHTAYPMPRRRDSNGKVIKNERNRIYGLDNANVDLYIEEFVNRYKSKYIST